MKYLENILLLLIIAIIGYHIGNYGASYLEERNVNKEKNTECSILKRDLLPIQMFDADGRNWSDEENTRHQIWQITEYLQKCN